MDARSGAWCSRWSSRPIVAGSIFTFSLTLGDYITVKIVGGANQLLGNLVYTNVGAANNLPFAAAVATIPIAIMIVYLTAARRTGARNNLEEPLMTVSSTFVRVCAAPRAALGHRDLVLLAVIYVPLFVVLVNSFNSDQTFRWPPPGFTLEWWGKAWNSEGAREALMTSVQVALFATVIALVLGTLAALAVYRSAFFGREAISFLLILPIALPGIVTGMAFQNGFRTILGIQLSLFTIVVAHATFCIVTVFNNVQARFQRLGDNFEQASMDLGAGRWTTFRLITFPMLRSALLAGGLLAFALSFDEIIVTTFTAGRGTTTLPIWILDNLFRPNQAPVVNCVAAALVLFSAIPIYLAQRLSGSNAEGLTGAR